MLSDTHQFRKGKNMQKQRTLSYSMSTKISTEDLLNISAAGSTRLVTDTFTHTLNGGTDTSIDISVDI